MYTFIGHNTKSLSIKVQNKYIIPSQEEIQLGRTSVCTAERVDSLDSVDDGNHLSK